MIESKMEKSEVIYFGKKSVVANDCQMKELGVLVH